MHNMLNLILCYLVKLLTFSIEIDYLILLLYRLKRLDKFDLQRQSITIFQLSWCAVKVEHNVYPAN